MSYVERSPHTVAMARKLARYPVNRRKRALREIAAELETAGHVALTGKRYGAAAILRMVGSPS
jgi:hypothetical protein